MEATPPLPQQRQVGSRPFRRPCCLGNWGGAWKTSALRRVCAGARALASSSIARTPPGSSTSSSRPVSGSVGLSRTASSAASEGARARTNGAMVGPGPAGGSGAPAAKANSWGSWPEDRSQQRPGLPLGPPPQALRGPGPVWTLGGKRRWVVWGGSPWNWGVPDSSGAYGVCQRSCGLQRDPWCREIEETENVELRRRLWRNCLIVPLKRRQLILHSCWACSGIVCADRKLRT